MSYSNSLLETPSTKIIEGIPGVGFKLTTDGNYDMENKKFTNLKPGIDDSDVLTKKQSYDHVKANSEYVKTDGSSVMKGHLLLDNNRVQDIAPPRQKKSDAIPYLYFSTWYMQFDDNNINLDVKNPIDMGNKKISNVKEGTSNSDCVNFHQLNNILHL